MGPDRLSNIRDVLTRALKTCSNIREQVMILDRCN